MSDKLAVVTGASSGIGLSLAKELASRGYDLVVCSSGERLSAATETMKSFGTNVTEVNADLSTREGVDTLWNEVEHLGRPVDVACICFSPTFFRRAIWRRRMLKSKRVIRSRSGVAVL